jgi:hypothetical protein
LLRRVVVIGGAGPGPVAARVHLLAVMVVAGKHG